MSSPPAPEPQKPVLGPPPETIAAVSNRLQTLAVTILYQFSQELRNEFMEMARVLGAAPFSVGVSYEAVEPPTTPAATPEPSTPAPIQPAPEPPTKAKPKPAPVRRVTTPTRRVAARTTTTRTRRTR
jgi:hypothetical protein